MEGRRRGRRRAGGGEEEGRRRGGGREGGGEEEGRRRGGGGRMENSSSTVHCQRKLHFNFF